MRFTKMEGLGNDYVYVNCFREKVYDPEILARLVSDRHRGIGGDGLILIGPSARADFNMDIYNADGSRAEITVETQAGIKRLRCILQDGRVVAVCVDMGRPDIGAAVEMAVLPDETVDFVRVSMGNPHAVVWVDDIYVCQMETLGPEMEVHPMFPNRTNVEFVQIVDEDHMRMRVWERGSGETFACGTGACAAVAAGIAAGRTRDSVKVSLLGGTLDIDYDRQNETMYMTGPGREVFEGWTDIY